MKTHSLSPKQQNRFAILFPGQIRWYPIGGRSTGYPLGRHGHLLLWLQFLLWLGPSIGWPPSPSRDYEARPTSVLRGHLVPSCGIFLRKHACLHEGVSKGSGTEGCRGHCSTGVLSRGTYSCRGSRTHWDKELFQQRVWGPYGDLWKRGSCVLGVWHDWNTDHEVCKYVTFPFNCTREP